jgi:hypothetical protein
MLSLAHPGELFRVDISTECGSAVE